MIADTCCQAYWVFVFEAAGEVIFVAASTLTHQVFNGVHAMRPVRQRLLPSHDVSIYPSSFHHPPIAHNTPLTPLASPQVELSPLPEGGG